MLVYKLILRIKKQNYSRTSRIVEKTEYCKNKVHPSVDDQRRNIIFF